MAGSRTGETRFTACEIALIEQVLPTQSFSMFDRHLAEVACGQHAHLIQSWDGTGGSPVVQALRACICRQFAADFPCQGEISLAVLRVKPSRAPAGNSFEILAAENGANPSAGSGVVTRNHEAGKLDLVLTGGSNDAGLNGRITQFLFDEVICFPCSPAPEVIGVSQFHLVIMDPEVDWFRRGAMNDQVVISGIFQFCAEMSSRAYLEIQPCRGAFGRDGRAT